MKISLTVILMFFAVYAQAGEAQRVVTVGGAITEIVYALGEESALVGNDTTSYYPPQADKLPKVGYQRTLSAEGILSLNPDLLLLTDEAGPATVLKQLESAGVEIVTIKAGRSIDDIKASIDAIANAFGAEVKAKQLIAKINQNYQQLEALKQEKAKGKKVMFILGHGGGTPMVAGDQTAADSIIQLSGGENVVKAYSGYKPLTPEAAVLLDPDVILITSQGLSQMGGKKALLAMPGISLTSAAKNGRVIAMDSLFLLGFGPRTVEAAISLNKAYKEQ